MNRSARLPDGSLLDRIVETKRSEVAGLGGRVAALRAQAEAAAVARPFASQVDRRGEVTLIAEYKRRSPSAGELGTGEPGGVARRYERAGAAAMSVLTDGPWFGGSLDDLVAARSAVGLPVLRKDFLIAEAQVWESRAWGADAVLLIVRILEDERLRGLLELSRELGMAALVEVHGGAELERALKAGASLVGVNNRDLATFRTDLGLSVELAAQIPADRVMVSESGIRSAADVDRLGEAGFDAVLVGETLMRAGEAEVVRGLVGRRKRDRQEATALWRATTC